MGNNKEQPALVFFILWEEHSGILTKREREDSKFPIQETTPVLRSQHILWKCHSQATLWLSHPCISVPFWGNQICEYFHFRIIFLRLIKVLISWDLLHFNFSLMLSLLGKLLLKLKMKKYFPCFMSSFPGGFYHIMYLWWCLPTGFSHWNSVRDRHKDFDSFSISLFSASPLRLFGEKKNSP